MIALLHWPCLQKYPRSSSQCKNVISKLGRVWQRAAEVVEGWNLCHRRRDRGSWVPFALEKGR